MIRIFTSVAAVAVTALLSSCVKMGNSSPSMDGGIETALPMSTVMD